MRNELADKKNRREHAVRQYTWGIHQICGSSGLPANEVEYVPQSDEKVGKARELIVKVEFGTKARDGDTKTFDGGFDERFLSGLSFEAENGEELEFLNQEHLEEVLGEGKSSKSYVAVVHIDGNAMGVKVSAFLKRQFTSNDDYVERYKEFTRNIDDAYKAAFISMIEHVMMDYPLWSKELYGNAEGNAGLRLKYSNVVPLRPIVASGDDICFIAIGQLGIELARVFVQSLQHQKLPIGNSEFSFESCAGVAIVRQKFPFWLAYELSERLCANAKKRLKEDAEYWRKKGLGDSSQSYDTSLIDWSLVTSGDIDLDLESSRKISYQNKDGSYLLNRSYYIQRESGTTHWHPANYMISFVHALNLVLNGNQPRSKWKALRGVYHQGVDATKQWQIQNQFRIEPNELFLDNEARPDHTAYFYDAIDMMDHMILLSEVK